MRREEGVGEGGYLCIYISFYCTVQEISNAESSCHTPSGVASYIP